MRAHTFTYILSLILLFCIPWGNMEVNAQRAQKRREGILTTDSIRSQNRSDSLALADTTNLQRKLALEALEAPVDTAALARQNDSIQNTLPPTQEKKRWIPNSNRTVWLGLVIPGAGQIYNRKTGRCIRIILKLIKTL